MLTPTPNKITLKSRMSVCKNDERDKSLTSFGLYDYRNTSLPYYSLLLLTFQFQEITRRTFSLFLLGF